MESYKHSSDKSTAVHPTGNTPKINSNKKTINNSPKTIPPRTISHSSEHGIRGRGRGRGGHGRGRGQNTAQKQEGNANISQQLEEMEAQITALQEIAEKLIPNKNAHGGNRQVHFDDKVNDFAEAVASQDDDDNDEAQEQFHQVKLLLDSAAFPSHVHSPASKTINLNSPIHVSTPNGSYSVNESAKITLPLQSGLIRTTALINRTMKTNLISPTPIIGQHGPIILTKAAAALIF